jgi:extracellular matrix regulatory protein A
MSNKHQEILKGSGGHSTLNVGYGNYLLIGRIVALLESGSLPMKRLREKASDKNLLVDATAGRKMRTLIITDSGHVVLSALAAQTLQERLQGGKLWLNQAEVELKEGEFVS